MTLQLADLNMPIIEVKHLTKEYDLGAVTSIKDSLRHTLAKIQGKDTWQRERFKALNDVNFTIEQGEVVGIIGHNGAGKSTLLKHLANITKPTSGEVIIRGSIAPLIEVGAGVNPELTGRENIFLNGAILGIPKKVIQSKLDEIIDFSELEQFIDTPVKRYSSGMTVKLGFSIATSMDADILIIDEVLAVGDLAFQRKCFDRMEDLIKRQGKTVLIVSHNLRQIERLCNRVICLSKGQIVLDGMAKEACNYFYSENNKKILTHLAANRRWDSSNDIDLINCELEKQTDSKENTIEHLSSPTFKINIKCHKKITNLTVVFGIHTTDFVSVGTRITRPGFLPESIEPGIYQVKLSINKLPLSPGAYGVRISLDIGDPQRNAFYADNVLHFQVEHSTVTQIDIENEGIMLLDASWSELDIAIDPHKQQA